MVFYFTNLIPLIEGVLAPTTLLLNFQSVGAPAWLAINENVNLLSTTTLSWHTTVHGRQYLKTRSLAVFILEYISMAFGVLANTSLFVRMLEKKIKWTTRLAGIGSLLQGFFGLLVVIVFIAQTASLSNKYHYTEGLWYALAACSLSLVNGGLFIYQRHLHRNQIYEHIMYELSIPQRQLVLAAICTYTYVILGALLFGFIEGWMFDDAVYWCVVTLTTIGFGDLTPQTWQGKVLLPVFAGTGIALVGTTIYSLRVVVLEITTLHLASRFVRHFGIDPDVSNSDSPDRADLNGFVEYDYNNTSHNYSKPVVRRGSYTGLPMLHRLSTSYEPPQTMIARLRSGSLDSPIPLKKGVLAEPVLIKTGENMDQGDDNETTPLLMQTPQQPNIPKPNNLAVPHNEELEATSNHQQKVRQPTTDSKMKNPRFPRSLVSSVVELGRLAGKSRTMVISRGSHLPKLTLIAGTEVKRRQVVEMTRATFQKQIRWASVAVIGNLLLFGAVFATLENWQFLDGVYFCFVALTTIGYGDVTPKTERARSLFIWYIFVGIACVTYLGSMIGERFQDSWTIEVSKIERRTDRYETKAALKRRYQAAVIGARKNPKNIFTGMKQRRKNAPSITINPPISDNLKVPVALDSTLKIPIDISRTSPRLRGLQTMPIRGSAPVRGILRIDRRTTWDPTCLLSRSLGTERFTKQANSNKNADDSCSEEQDEPCPLRGSDMQADDSCSEDELDDQSDYAEDCESHSGSDGDHVPLFMTEEECGPSSSSAR